MDEKAFERAQESIVNELSLARNELIAGRNEEVYNILTNLIDELTTDLICEDAKKELNDDRDKDNI